MANRPHSESHRAHHPSHAGSARSWLLIALAVMAGLPSLTLTLTGHRVAPELVAIVGGLAILGSAFLLSWTLEVAQLHISASFAIAILALVAILPEYVIEAVLSWDAGAAWHAGASADMVPEVGRAAANVTGANRLLIGLGWSMVTLFFWIRNRRALTLTHGLSLELTILTVATLLSFLLFFMKEVSLYLSAVLIAIYLFYLWASSRASSEEPELFGPSATIGRLQRRPQILITLLLFVYAVGVVFAAAEPFVGGLIETGRKFGIPEFTLIQWLAPIASETPEMVVALLLTLRANPLGGMAVLISSGVNKFTLLVGSMPIVFSISYGHPASFPLDSQQMVEFLLTGSAALFAVCLLARMRIPLYGALVLLLFFIVQLFFVDSHVRLIFSIVYLALTALILVLDRGRIVDMYRRAAGVFTLRPGGESNESNTKPPF